MNKPKYFLYARKSTEDEERQVMSIEAQLAELAEYAKRENLEIVEKFIESKSAKKPGREIFNDMICKIEHNDGIGILAWRPDRLARNSVDGGKIIYLIDTGKIVSLKFPTFWFEPTPQGLFMLQVAFGQSKYYSDNLSENVKRGIRQKLRRGEWPGLAPVGYVNNPRTRNIGPDPIKARVIKKAFAEFANSKHTLKSLGEYMSFLGITSKTGKALCVATIQRMLSNPIYIGIIKRGEEVHQGNFEPIISQRLFDKVQQILKERAKPRKSKKQHDFAFRGLLRCGECGAAITAQFAHGNGGVYRYYRCTKRLSPCSQRYLREELFAQQIKQKLQNIVLCKDWQNKMLGQVEIWQKEKTQSSKSVAQNLETKLEEVNEKFDKLVSLYLDELLSKEIYSLKQENLLKQKISLEQRKKDFGRREKNWIEPLRDWINTCYQAKNLIFSNNDHQIKQLVDKVGTNRKMFNQKVSWDWVKPWDILAYSKEKLKICSPAAPAARLKIQPKNLTFLDWSGYRDSNSE